jgi:hypothetical protein
MLSRATTRALRAALLACATVCATAAPAAGASPDVAYPANGPAMEAALFTAKSFWGEEPCGGKVQVTWADLSLGDAALSHWLTFGETAYAAPETHTDCRIEFNRRQTYDFPKLCTVAVHEVGHLLGHDHTHDHTHVMAETYSRPLPVCLDVAAKAGYTQDTPVAKPAAKRRTRRLTRKQRIARLRATQRARLTQTLR